MDKEKQKGVLPGDRNPGFIYLSLLNKLYSYMSESELPSEFVKYTDSRTLLSRNFDIAGLEVNSAHLLHDLCAEGTQ